MAHRITAPISVNVICRAGQAHEWLITSAQAKLEAMQRGGTAYPDDDILVIPRGGNPGAGPGASAALFDYDPTVDEIFATAKPVKLLRNDGTIVTQVVHSVFVPEPKLAELHRTFDGGTKVLTLRSFLSANAVRASNSLQGIDHCSSNNSTICAVQSDLRARTVRRDGRTLFCPRHGRRIRAREKRRQGHDCD